MGDPTDLFIVSMNEEKMKNRKRFSSRTISSQRGFNMSWGEIRDLGNLIEVLQQQGAPRLTEAPYETVEFSTNASCKHRVKQFSKELEEFFLGLSDESIKLAAVDWGDKVRRNEASYMTTYLAECFILGIRDAVIEAKKNGNAIFAIEMQY